MLINALPSWPTQPLPSERVQSTAPPENEISQTEQWPTIAATQSSGQTRFQEMLALLHIDNLASVNSRIVDTDFAQETSTLTKLQILQQAGVAMLSQANSQPRVVLSLLGG